MIRPRDPELDVKKNPVPLDPKPKPLTPEMRKRVSKEKGLELRARAEFDLEDQLNKEAEEAYLAEMRKKVREEKEPDRAKRPIFIDLPPEAPYLLTDGQVCYYPDTEYQVTKEVYDDLNSRIWMAWCNEANRLDDKTANQYKRSRNAKVSRKGAMYG